ncbi:AlpA family phage regulatory protein [Paracoccus sp. MC1854]|uniref:helix-turn-helix transcriptional regulator n=1 Tax=Paracoccus sp. MC1854 TaxID=2760306 RepID=UPI0015FF25B1|nr:AlpA family phage regulatory protein [Paracoccus sp. MC1854]MBB1492964.1 AlpA family phage regulatory protein [Paracoccus sp. MC1854]
MSQEFHIRRTGHTAIPPRIRDRDDKQPQVHPEWMTDRQVAAWLSCHKSTVWDMAKKGRLPKPYKLSNGMSRWLWSELQSWKSQVVA